jgi:hypothetical protein
VRFAKATLVLSIVSPMAQHVGLWILDSACFKLFELLRWCESETHWATSLQATRKNILYVVLYNIFFRLKIQHAETLFI